MSRLNVRIKEVCSMCRRWTTLLVALLCVTTSAGAETYPSHPLRVLVPFATGSSADLSIRSLAGPLSQKLGQPVVVENRAGNGGAFAVQAAVQSPPDGHTLLAITTGMFEPTDKFALSDVSLLALMTTNSVVLVVSATSPYKTLQDLVRGVPKNYALNRVQSSVGELASERLVSLANICAEKIRYNGDSQALLDVIRGEVGFMFAQGPGVSSHLQAGTLRALAVADAERSVFLPDVPTVAEAMYPNFRVRPAGLGLAVRKDTPREVQEHLSRVLREISQDPALQAHFAAGWWQLKYVPGDEFEEYARAYPTPVFVDPCSRIERK